MPESRYAAVAATNGFIALVRSQTHIDQSNTDVRAGPATAFTAAADADHLGTPSNG